MHRQKRKYHLNGRKQILHPLTKKEINSGIPLLFHVGKFYECVIECRLILQGKKKIENYSIDYEFNFCLKNIVRKDMRI